MIKKTYHTSLILYFSTLVLLSGCGIYSDIVTNADSNTNFCQYHTFAWLPDQIDTTNLPYNNEIIRNNIKNYFGQSFADRGYRVELDSPDVLLSLKYVNVPKENVIIVVDRPFPFYYSRYYYGSDYYFPYYFDYYYHDHSFLNYSTELNKKTSDYIESSITLNVIDRKLNKLVWTGTASADIYDLSYLNKNIHPAVEAIMRRYPVNPIPSKNRKVKYLTRRK